MANVTFKRGSEDLPSLVTDGAIYLKTNVDNAQKANLFIDVGTYRYPVADEIYVGADEPENGQDLWIPGVATDFFNAPEIKDDEISTLDTWSSAKISEEISNAVLAGTDISSTTIQNMISAQLAQMDLADLGAITSTEALTLIANNAVTSINGKKGAVTINIPVTSVNGKTGAVTIDVPVTSVNGKTGAVTIDTLASGGTITGNLTVNGTITATKIVGAVYE